MANRKLEKLKKAQRVGIPLAVLEEIADVQEAVEELQQMFRDTNLDRVDLTSLTALKGDKGDKGDKGERGLQGIQGPKGDKGNDGRSVTPQEVARLIDRNDIAERVLNYIDGDKIAINTINFLELLEGDDRLDASAIKNLEQNIDISKLLPPQEKESIEFIAEQLNSLEGEDRIDFNSLKNKPDFSKLSIPTITGGGNLGVFNSGVKIGSGTEINFTGSAVSSVTHDGHRATIELTASAGAGSGDVTGPASATDNAIARFDGAGGKDIQNSGVTIDDTNNLSGVNNVTGADANFVTGTAGTANNLALWNVDGDLVDASVSVADLQQTDEEIQDLVGAMFSTNTETGITATYQDADGTIDLVVSDLTVAGDTGSTGMTPGDTLTVAGGTGITTAMSGDTLTITATGGGGGSGTLNTIKEGGVQLGGADIATLDFDGNDFNLTESPDTEVNIVINDAGIDHDATTNFVANEHIDHSSVNINAGNGLSGGGDLTTTRTINVDINGTTDLVSPASGDEILLGDVSNSNAIRKSDIGTVLALYDSQTATLTNKSGSNNQWTNDAGYITDISGFSTTNLSEGSNLYFTDERAQDAVGTILADSSEIDFTYNDATPSITASLVAGSIDETKLDTSVNASLDLADSSLQSGDNISTLTNDSGYITGISGENINDLGDVTITTPADNEVLAYNNGTSTWINQTPAEAGLAEATHTHATTDITSGTFADARIAQSNVTQHEAALTITESQISDLGTYYEAGGTDVALADGGTGASLVDPNADRIMFWDDSAGAVTWLTAGSGLTITGTTITASGGGGSADVVSKDVTQASHGLSVGDVVKYSGGAYSTAQANSASNAEVIGIVSAVADTDNFTVVTHGYVSGLSGLTANTQYFLSPSSAGDLTATEPTTTGHIIKPVFFADSTSSGFFINYRGMEITAVGSVPNQLNDLSDATISTPSSGHILVYDGTDSFDNVAMSGDVTINNSGVTAIGSGVIVNADINASAAIDASKIHDGSISNTEFGYLNGVSSAIQTQIDGKADTSHTHATGDITSGTFADARIAQSNVTQHQAALSITESQISDLGTYLTNINGEDLNDLADVVITTPTDNEVLAYDNGSGNFINQTPAEAGLASASHTHTKADLTDIADFLLESEVDVDIKTLSLPANTTISTFGASLVDDADAPTALTTLGLTATASEINTLDGITATVTELNYTDGVTSPIQTQIDGKIGGSTGATDNALIRANGTGGGTVQNSGITVDDSDNLAGVNKLEADATISFSAETDNGNSGTSDTIDWGAGNKQKSTLTGNVTYTFTAPDGPCSLTLRLIQDGTGSRTATWPATVKWPGGTAPTLTTTASAIDIVSFYYDGTNYYGQAALNFS